MTMMESGVLIVGGGPVGLTLAIDLAWRGIDVTVVELRAAARDLLAKYRERRDNPELRPEGARPVSIFLSTSVPLSQH